MAVFCPPRVVYTPWGALFMGRVESKDNLTIAGCGGILGIGL